MKRYCEIGERTKWRGNQFRCVEYEGSDIAGNCELCGLFGDRLVCHLTACMRYERPDKKNVYFRLEPRFRKEEKQ
jgi:hypothetical protein